MLVIVGSLGHLYTDFNGHWRLRDLFGHIYHRVCVRQNGNFYWKCQNHHKTKSGCPVKIVTKGDLIVCCRGIHNH